MNNETKIETAGTVAKLKKLKVTFSYGGSAYLALTYAKMKNKKFSSRDLAKCLSGKFRTVDGATKALKVLEKNKCVERLSVSHWAITPRGIEIMTAIAATNRSMYSPRGPE